MHMAIVRHIASPPTVDQLLAHIVHEARDTVALLRRRDCEQAVGSCEALAAQSRWAAQTLDFAAIPPDAEAARGDALAALGRVTDWAANACELDTPRRLAADELAVHAQAVAVARAELVAAGAGRL